MTELERATSRGTLAVAVSRGWKQLHIGAPSQRHKHVAAVALLMLLNAIFFRRLIFEGGVPDTTDSAFLYSMLPFFQSHHIHDFTVWLPAPFGQVQQYSLYWALGNTAALVGHPLAVYDGAVVFVAVLTSVGMYGFAYWLTRSATASVLCAALYSFTPFIVTQWLDGHLNVAVAYAAGPIAMWSLWAGIRDGSRAGGFVLGLAMSALYLLTTGQGVYWALPLAAIGVTELIVATRRRTLRVWLRRAAGTSVVAVAVFVVTSAVQLWPLVHGARAPFLESGSRYYIQGLAIHEKYSLPLADNVFGVPREIYLHAGETLTAGGFNVVFRVAGWILLLVSLISLRSSPRFSLALLGTTVVAWVVAAGPSGTTGSLYRGLYYTVPYISFLRVPNRWLMVSAAATTLMIALAVAAAQRREHPRVPVSKRRSTKIVIGLFLCGAVLGKYAFLNGFPVWSPPRAYAAAYEPLRNDRSDWRIATSPFFQAWMPAGRQSEQTITADLGYTSSFWHGHAVVGRGGWDPRAARFATYIYRMIEQGSTHSLARILGAAGVKYVALNPHRAIEVPGRQNAVLSAQGGLTLKSAVGGVRIYRNEFALPDLVAPRRLCVIAGGFEMLDGLARNPTFDFGRVGVAFADQIVHADDRATLRRLIAAHGCLLVGRGGRDTLNVLLHSTYVSDGGVYGPMRWTRADVNPAIDIAADPVDAVDIPPSNALTSTIDVRQPGIYSLWLALVHESLAGEAVLTIDGRDVTKFRVRTPFGSRVAWDKSPSIFLARGAHTFRLSNSSTLRSLTLTRLAVMPDKATRERRIFLTPAAHFEQFPTIARVRRRNLRPLADGRWRALPSQPRFVASKLTAHGISLQVVRSNRPFFTVADVPAKSVAANHLFALRVRGAGTGEIVYLSALFGRDKAPSVSFRFIDEDRSWRTIIFSPQQPDIVYNVPEWRKITSFRISTNSKARWRRRLIVEGPYEVSGPSLAPHVPLSRLFVGNRGQVAVTGRPGRIVIGARLGAVPSGLLVFNQSFDKRWKLVPSDGRTIEHIPVLGFENGYVLSSAAPRAQLAYEDAAYGRRGGWLSVGGWIVAITLLPWLLRPRPEVRTVTATIHKRGA